MISGGRRQGEEVRAFNIMIKPASSACNMACGYCFYRDIAGNRDVADRGMLSLDRMERLVANALADADVYCGFVFQGGEPTLAGLDFFRAVVEFQRRHNTRGTRVENFIQTNGYCVDGDWADFFRENSFLVGLSLDGPAEVHNSNRVDHGGGGTFNRVMNAMHVLRERGAEFNVLSVVTGQNARRIASIYRFFMKHEVRHLQFIPCLEPLEARRGDADWHLSSEEYGRYLIRVFDLWFEDLRKGRYTSVRHIDNWLSILLGNRPEACSMTGRCSVQYVVEGDGGVYPCDFYVYDEWCLGSVDDSFDELGRGETARRFVDASLAVPERCRACPWAGLCRNGCRRDRLPPEGGGVAVNFYCPSLRAFFEARIGAMREACSILRRMQAGNLG